MFKCEERLASNCTSIGSTGIKRWALSILRLFDIYVQNGMCTSACGSAHECTHTDTQTRIARKYFNISHSLSVCVRWLG